MVPVGFGLPVVAFPAGGAVVVGGVKAGEEEGGAREEFAAEVGGDEAGGGGFGGDGAEGAEPGAMGEDLVVFDGEDLFEAVEGGGGEPVEFWACFGVVAQDEGVVGAWDGEGFWGVDGVVEVDDEVSGGDADLVEWEVAADVGEDDDAGGAGGEGEEGSEWVVEGCVGGWAVGMGGGGGRGWEDDVGVHEELRITNYELRIGKNARLRAGLRSDSGGGGRNMRGD